MTRVESDYGFGIPADRPAANGPGLDLVKVTEILVDAGIAEEEEAVVAFLRQTTARYQSAQARDEASATPSQVAAYAKRLEKAVAAIRPGANPAKMDAALSTRKDLEEQVQSRKRNADLSEAPWLTEKQKFNEEEIASLAAQGRGEETIIRAVMSPFEFADLQDRFEAFAQSVRTLADDVRATKAGSGPRLEAARQRALAGWFWTAFGESGWPIEFTDDGRVKAKTLMPELLRLVLQATGEDRATVTAILNDTRPQSRPNT